MLYILLARVTDEGQQRLRQHPEFFTDLCNEVRVPDTQLLARYAVLGRYDFVVMAEATTPEAVARLSLEMGSRAGLHVETLSAISAGILADPWDKRLRTEPVLAGEAPTGEGGPDEGERRQAPQSH